MKATLTYHSIDESGSAISVSNEVFEAHLRWLASGRVRVLSLDDLATDRSHDDDALAVTFDDGFLNAQGAVERLLDHGLPVTIFVVSGHVGGTNAWGRHPDPDIPQLPVLGWSDLERLAARGAAIEAHTRHHVALTRIPASALDDELRGCQEDLQARLGIHSSHLAYPYGDVDDTVIARAARCFQSGHTTEFRAMTDQDDAMQLPRLDMYYFQAPGSLEAWGTAAFRRRLAWVRARRAVRARLFGGWAPRRRPSPESSPA